MVSKTDICNLALSHFGQAADISSIDPPDGSAEAEPTPIGPFFEPTWIAIQSGDAGARLA